MTQIKLDNILKDQKFTECINEAAPYRIKIIQDYTPRMKEIKQTYLEAMIDVDFRNVSEILQKLKLDKKDESAKIDYNGWKKDVMKLFQMTLKSIHPNENQTPSIGMIYVAGKMLNYIGRNDIVNAVMEDKNITVSFKRLEDINLKFDNDDTRARFIQIFKDADDTQGHICNAADEIKKTIYDELPSEVKFDKKDNKSGLKPPHFQALVRNKAMASVKDKDKYTKYISIQVSNSNDNISREEVIKGKTKQM